MQLSLDTNLGLTKTCIDSSENNISLAGSQLDSIQTPSELTADFFYLGFIDDISIDEKDYDKMQKNGET